MKLAFIALISLVVGLASQVNPSSPMLQRAADLFREAREAIPTVVEAPPATAEYQQAGLLLTMAQNEVAAFPDAAADDAARAFRLVLTLPGGGPDFDFSQAQRDPAAMPAALGRMAKAQLEPGAIKVLVQAKQSSRAHELARDGDIDCADLYDAIIRDAPLDQVPSLVAECQASGGSYPFVAIADRARSVSGNSPQRRSLLEPAYAAAASAMEFKDRSLALVFIQRTWACDLVSSDIAQSALDSLLRQIIAHPAEAPGGKATDRDLFGPQILELMIMLNPQKAGVIATDHPDWEAARKIPGRSPGNPVGGPAGPRPLRPACPPQPATPPSQPANSVARPNAPDAARAMTATEFDQAVEGARSLSPTSVKIQKLISLAALLLTKPPQ